MSMESKFVAPHSFANWLIEFDDNLTEIFCSFLVSLFQKALVGIE